MNVDYYNKLLLDADTEDFVDEMLAFYECMRRLGFLPDEIFVADHVVDRVTGIKCWGVVLRVAGIPAEWSGAVGTPKDHDAFAAAWQAVAKKTKVISEARATRLWKERMPLPRMQAIAESVILKGLPIRAVMT